ncbi:TRAP transporter small permease [Tropicimonas sp. IMCC34011]|uniref:TRAP transporter small permease n=1 Tax=Tropicimonas sp. IMCC34011 TaxID=2248759 RepID=UPI000E2628AD|nr:TRAP transporter small permease [Tropicimonas sp. IMCC34011]
MTDAATKDGRRALHVWGARAKFFADAVGIVLFLSAFCGFIIQVFYRYALNSPLLWTEEFVMIAFIWTVFWAAAFTVPVREHVSFDVVYDVVSERTKRIFSMISLAAAIAAFVLLVPYTWDYLSFMARRDSSVLRIPMNLVYGCYILFLVGFTIQAVYRLARLFGPHWRHEI